MHSKISDTKFTIQFKRTDPSHLRVTEILNQQERGGKAQYIVDAVMHYVNSGEAKEALLPRPVLLDEKHIEAVVERILRNREKSNGAVEYQVDTNSAPAATVYHSEDNEQLIPQVQPIDEVIFDDAVKALGAEGFNAVVGALDMFRRK